MALTVNAVFHRQNMARVSDVIDWAVDVNAQRLEIANVQYYGWGLENRRNLMPRLSQLEEMNRVVQDRIEALKGIIVIDYVVPDYFARRPKACMNGWGRRFFNVMPNGVMIPCHAAQTIPDMEFENVQDKSVGWIWQHSEAFNRFRGTAWMPEPCRSCDRREIDWAGCRCQALALTGSASNPDPVCDKVEGHAQIREQAFSDSSLIGEKFVYRTFSGSR